MYNYYVYAYLRKDRTPYYIGKGKGKRVYENHRHVPVPKDKKLIVFWQRGLLEEDAHSLEIKYIKLFGRKDIKTGILINLTDGGEGQSGYKHSEKTKKKIGKMSIGRGLGKPRSEETKRKISESHNGLKMPMRSIEHRQKLSVANKGKYYPQCQKNNENQRKKVIFGSQKFNSVKEASVFYNVSRGTINNWSKKGIFISKSSKL